MLPTRPTFSSPTPSASLNEQGSEEPGALVWLWCCPAVALRTSHSSQLPPVPLNPSSVQRATPLPAGPLTSKVTCVWGRTTFWEGTWRLADK